MSVGVLILEAVYDALTTDGAYMELVVGVYDEVPEATDYPYTLIGDETETPDHVMEAEGFEHELVIHDWSEYAGTRECLRIRKARNDVLHRARLTVAGWGLTPIEYVWGAILREWDEKEGKHLRHQVTRYRVRSLGN